MSAFWNKDGKGGEQNRSGSPDLLQERGNDFKYEEIIQHPEKFGGTEN